MKNVVEKAKAMHGKINPYYDLRASEIAEIYQNSADAYDMICTGFLFGYMQGAKSAKAKMQKGGVA